MVSDLWSPFRASSPPRPTALNPGRKAVASHQVAALLGAEERPPPPRRALGAGASAPERSPTILCRFELRLLRVRALLGAHLVVAAAGRHRSRAKVVADDVIPACFDRDAAPVEPAMFRVAERVQLISDEAVCFSFSPSRQSLPAAADQLWPEVGAEDLVAPGASLSHVAPAAAAAFMSLPPLGGLTTFLWPVPLMRLSFRRADDRLCCALGRAPLRAGSGPQQP